MFDSEEEMTPATFLALNGGLVLLTVLAGFISEGVYIIFFILFAALVIGLVVNGLMLIKATARHERGLSIAYGVTAGLCVVLLWQLFHIKLGKISG